MKKILSWTAVGILSMGALAACGSDDDKKSPSTTEAPAATNGDSTETTAGGDSTETTAGGASDENAATVEKFCSDVADLVAKGPTASDYATKLQELIGQGTSLGAAVAADPTLQGKLTECLTKLTPGG